MVLNMRYSKFIYTTLPHPLELIDADGQMNEIVLPAAELK